MRYHYVPASDLAHSIALAGPPAAAAAAYRILVPQREARDVERVRCGDSLASLETLILAHGGQVHMARYAMAEEIATATLVESLALSFVTDGPHVRAGRWRRGAAVWIDWKWSHALVSGGGGRLSRAGLEAIITGVPQAMPEIRGCPRCGTATRVNRDGSMRVHNQRPGVRCT